MSDPLQWLKDDIDTIKETLVKHGEMLAVWDSRYKTRWRIFKMTILIISITAGGVTACAAVYTIVAR